MQSKLPYALCEGCSLVHGMAVPGNGPLDADVIVVGEAPGATEEAEGIPFVGQSGALLDAAFEQAGCAFGLSLVYKTNVVACRPPGNRTPTEKEIACCKPRLAHEMSQLTGKKVVALGHTAQNAFNIPTAERGAVYQREDKLVMGNWHPAYILRSPKDASEFLGLIRRSVQGPFELNYIKWPEVRWVNTLEQLKIELEACASDSWVAFDIETDQVQWYETPTTDRDSILMLQIAWTLEYALILSDEMLYDTPGVVEELQRFFNRVKTIGHNAKFDCVFLKAHLGLNVYQDFDTMLAHYSLDESIMHGLKFVVRNEFGIPDYEEETISKYLVSKNDRYSKVPPEDLAKYGAMDVVTLLPLRELLEGRLRDQGFYEWPFKNILMDAANCLTEVELRGMLVDTNQLDKASIDLGVLLERLTEEIRGAVGMPCLNPNSTQQLAEVLFDGLHLPQGKGRKVPARSTNHDALVSLLGKHPVIPILLQQRRVQKIKSSYVENLRGYLDRSGRVHATFKIQGTEVSRLAVANPALQTIPRPSDYYGALIRSSFVADQDMTLLVCDYSQAELRIYACESLDPFLLQVYKDDRDLHTEVALGMYGPSWTKEQRVICKMFNFSYVYGGNEYSFAQDSGLNIDVARQFVRDYNKLMPVGLAWKRHQLELAKTQGYVETRFGRRRRFPLITQEIADDVRKACVHMPCASSASDLTLLSANSLIKRGVPIVLTVHDSCIAECPKTLANEFSEMMITTMRSMGEKYFPEVPWKVDLEVSDRWAKPLPMPEGLL